MQLPPLKRSVAIGDHRDGAPPAQHLERLPRAVHRLEQSECPCAVGGFDLWRGRVRTVDAENAQHGGETIIMTTLDFSQQSLAVVFRERDTEHCLGGRKRVAYSCLKRGERIDQRIVEVERHEPGSWRPEGHRNMVQLLWRGAMANFADVLEGALALDAADRDALMARLVVAGAPDLEIERDWDAEVARRIAEDNADTARSGLVSWDEVEAAMTALTGQ